MLNFIHHEEQGRRHFNEGNFLSALGQYRDALNELVSQSDFPNPKLEQCILSNIIACRLKISDCDNLAIATEEAKRCIALNPCSTKGHIRLASVYIALGHSNDACQALQSAIGIEPSNSLARALLTNELRRDNRPNDEPHSNDYIGTEYVELDAIDGEFLVNRTINHSIADEHNGRGISLMESMNRRLLLLRSWYRTSGENTKTCVQISCCILILYVAFGGRFGLDTLTAGGGYSHRQADYSSKNAYERFRSINSAYGSRNSNSWHGRRTTGHQRSYTYRYSGSRQHATTSNSSYSRNLPFVLVIILVFILHCLGVPIGTVAPILFGLRRRRFGFGVGNMRFGGGGFDFGNGGLFGARGMRVPMNYGMYRQHR